MHCAHYDHRDRVYNAPATRKFYQRALVPTGTKMEENMKSRFITIFLQICIGMVLACVAPHLSFCADNKATFVVG